MTTGIDPARLQRLEETAERARELLLSQRTAGGHWVGELSSSALSTATATAALALALDAAPEHAAELLPLVQGGRSWLAEHRNADGGWGDTVDSPSNLSTTALGWMALGIRIDADEPGEVTLAHRDAARWIEECAGGRDAPRLARALAEIYGEDKTFAVPILSACAIGGAFAGDDGDPWRSVPRLPYELAALPQGLFRFLGLPVVSYALPALIAIGQAIEAHRPSRNPLTRGLRIATRASTLRVLERIQPENGGFLEATPLTSFVLLSLISIDEAGSRVAQRCGSFLTASVRTDGSWPIDTNLATWTTTLAVGALGEALPEEERTSLRAWLLAQQGRERHPYTGAAAGGWAWTDLPGGVPDADDTPGALLALHALGGHTPETRAAAAAGLRWLADLQNRDGGIPTFCRGWGKLPFDKSCPDLTAHALRAWAAWSDPAAGDAGDDTLTHADAARRARRFLVADQRADGAWVPLWFGNQEEEGLLNPVYGTSRVLRAAGAGSLPAGPASTASVASVADAAWRAALERGLAWLVGVQKADGGFGGGPRSTASLEETALALEALCDCHVAGLAHPELEHAIGAAADWLVTATDEGRRFRTRPIGLYFARLWYSERLYPLVYGVSALERARRILAP